MPQFVPGLSIPASVSVFVATGWSSGPQNGILKQSQHQRAYLKCKSRHLPPALWLRNSGVGPAVYVNQLGRWANCKGEWRPTGLNNLCNPPHLSPPQPTWPLGQLSARITDSHRYKRHKTSFPQRCCWVPHAAFCVMNTCMDHTEHLSL